MKRCLPKCQDCDQPARQSCDVCGVLLCDFCWLGNRLRCDDCIEKENEELDREVAKQEQIVIEVD